MRFLDFKEHFAPFQVFSTDDILKWDPGFDTRRLVEWQNKSYLKKIINKWYLFTDTVLNESMLCLVANRIYAPSYISFESALAYYRIIPEAVYTVTSATSLKTNTFESVVGIFSYRHIKPELMFGYRLLEVNNQYYKMADPEKMLLDYFYLNSSLKSADDFESLRINQSVLVSLMNKNRLKEYLQLFESKALEKRIGTFLQYVKHDQYQ